MSVVTAHSSSAVAARPIAGARSPWILGRFADLVLFVATPALALPLFLLAETRWSAGNLALAIVALGGVGHHLPGMMRAYGDRELFERYRLRFIVAPIVLLAVCCTAAVLDLKATQLVALFWALWHSLAQTYGFLRIYDAKAGSFAAWTRRLDRAMCVAWFVGGAIFSAPRLSGILSFFYESGGPLVSPSFVAGLRTFWMAGTALVTALFLANLALSFRRGQRQSLVKVFLLATSIAFWWFCMTSFPQVIVGIALFEIFHDTQYLSIVWVYNGNRLTKNPDQWGFMRFIFRRNGVLLVLYVGLVLLYGYGSYSVAGIPNETLRNVLLGVVLSSTLLHYYYDGFIWRVREKGTRENLGVKANVPEAAVEQRAPRMPQWARHALYWTIFAVPIGGFGLAQISGVRPELEWRRAVVEAVPESATAQNNYGAALYHQGQRQGAREYFQRALELDPDYAQANVNLGSVLLDSGRADEAEFRFRRALRLDPGSIPARDGLARALQSAGELDEAIALYRELAANDPDDAHALASLGSALFAHGEADQAEREYRRALELAPNFADAHLGLAQIAQRAGRSDEALAGYERVLELDPGRGEAHGNVALLLHSAGRLDEALVHYQRAIELDAGGAELRYNLGLALQSLGRLDEAIATYEKAIELQPDYAQAYNNQGLAFQAQGELEAAVQRYQRALELDPSYAIAHANLGLALQARGEAARAFEHLTRAIELRPDYAKGHFFVAQHLLASGSRELAIEHFERALELDPGLAEARRMLDSLRSTQGR